MDLAAERTEGLHYKILFTPRASNVLVMAPHGGGIEPGTSDIARSIAGNLYSIYCFEGIQSSDNYEDLHITSENFDEPVAQGALSRARWVLAVHGYRERLSAFVMVGGLHRGVKSRMERFLMDAGFNVRAPGAGFTGSSRRNLCNRGISRQGCQLEISKGLRDGLLESTRQLDSFAYAAREALRTASGRL